jgi:uncharacterized protein (DUF433 family)
VTALATLEVPLRREDDGTLRVGNTRVTLETVIAAFSRGATPEEIVQRFPTLDLADVYAVAAYYLQNRDDVDAYLRQQQTEADALRRKIEARFSPVGLRERLLARRASAAERRERGDADASHR